MGDAQPLNERVNSGDKVSCPYFFLEELYEGTKDLRS